MCVPISVNIKILRGYPSNLIKLQGTEMGVSNVYTYKSPINVGGVAHLMPHPRRLAFLLLGRFSSEHDRKQNRSILYQFCVFGPIGIAIMVYD